MKIRLSDEELAELRRRAGGLSPQRYLCEVALADGPPTVSERRRRVVELGALTRQLVRLAADVGQLAQQATATGRHRRGPGRHPRRNGTEEAPGPAIGKHWTMTVLRVAVPDEIAERLAREASERGTSTEDMVSEVLVAHVPVPNRRRPGFIGLGHSGRGDISERAEELLAEAFDR